MAGLFVRRDPREHARPDNGPDFVTTVAQGRLSRVRVKTLSIEPGNPRENDYNQSFDGKLRDGFPGGKIFCPLREAAVLIGRW